MHKELEFLLNAKRWLIMQAISQGKNSATSIASHLKISIAHASNQLQLLEAKNYLKKDKTTTSTIGKPRTTYTINKELVILAQLSQHSTFIHTIRPAPEAQFIINTLQLQSEQDIYDLQKFYYTHEDLIFSMAYMGLLDITPHEIHFLAITNHVENVRKEHSNITINNYAGKKRKIVLWSHTKEEVINGLRNKETYYMEKVKKMEPYWEREVSAAELQQALEEDT